MADLTKQRIFKSLDSLNYIMQNLTTYYVTLKGYNININ